MISRPLSSLACLALSGCFLARPAGGPAADPAQTGATGAPQDPGAGSDGSNGNSGASGSSGDAGRSGPSGTGSSGSSATSGVSGSRGTTPAAPPPPEKIYSVSVDFKNECSDKVEYCVDSGGSTLNTSLGSNTSTSSTLSPGTKIQLKKDNRCGTTIFTVPESKERQKVILCER